MKTIQIHIYNSDSGVHYELVVHQINADERSKDYDFVFNAACKAVLTGTGITVEELMSANRERQLVDLRRYIIAIMRELTNAPLERIGKMLGGRDHATVRHNRDKHKDLMQVDDGYRKNYKILKSMVEAVI